MFDPELIFQFYDYDPNDPSKPPKSQPPQKVIDAYVSCVYEFGIQQDSDWKKYCDKLQDPTEGTYKGQFTVTDEAYVYYLIHQRYKEARDDVKVIKEQFDGNVKLWKKECKKKKQGKTDKSTQYTEFRHRFLNWIKMVRKKKVDAFKFWEELFFNTCSSIGERPTRGSTARADILATNVGSQFDSDYDSPYEGELAEV